MKLYWVVRDQSEGGEGSEDESCRKSSERRVSTLAILVPIKHNQFIYKNVLNQTFCNASSSIATELGLTVEKTDSNI